MDAGWLNREFGALEVGAQGSSRTHEDTTATEDGGLLERRLTLTRFLRAAFFGSARLGVNYVKLVAGNRDKRQFERRLGDTVLTELSRALAWQRVCFPPQTTWSLWVGGRGSVTAMHVDYQSFNVLYIVRGAKRLVLVPPEVPYKCTQRVRRRASVEPRRPGTGLTPCLSWKPLPLAEAPRVRARSAADALCPLARLQPRVRRWDVASCWSGVDILTAPPPAATEVVLRAGDALVIPEHYWHAAENLEPTIAVGMNSLPPPAPPSADDDGEDDEGDERRRLSEASCTGRRAWWV